MKTLLSSLCLLILMSFTYNEFKQSSKMKIGKDINGEIPKRFIKSQKVLANHQFKKKTKQHLVLNGNLVAHSNLVFLENISLKDSDFDRMKDITEQMVSKSTSVKVYKLENEKLLKKYTQLIGKQVQLNNYDRKQYPSEVIDLVIVNDGLYREPYVAALLKNDNGEHVYYGWTSSLERNSYPFKKTEFEEGADEQFAWMYKESKYYSDLSASYDDSYEYQTDNVFQFIGESGEEYVLVQNCLIGTCESLIESEIIVYKKSGEIYNPISAGSCSKYVVDMIDVDGDGFPEVLVGEFTNSGLLDVSTPKVRLKSTLSWSFDGCAC